MDGNTLLTQPAIKVRPDDHEIKIVAFAEREKLISQQMAKRAASVGYQDPAELESKPEVQILEQI